MDLLATIMNRRSIRCYQQEQIGDSALQAILTAAIHAPNGMNKQKWHFSVLQNKSLIDTIVSVIKENINVLDIGFLKEKLKDPAYHTFYQAPTVIMISGEVGAQSIQFDCGAAAENMCLAAASFGISSCIIGSAAVLFETEKGRQLKREIGIPDTYTHICSVALGFVKGEKPAVPKRNREVINFVR
jgi:nitroreductase